MNSAPTFLGTILSVSGSTIIVQLTAQVQSGLLIIGGRTHRIGQVGSFIRIPQGYNNLYGVISETVESGSTSDTDPRECRTIKIELVGESVGDQFERGLSQFPSIGDEAHLVTELDLKTIYGSHQDGQVTIGRLSSSDSIDVSLDLDSLVNRHSALLGSTGSGKSTSVSSLLRSIVTSASGEITKPSARIVLFDIHGEYTSALSDVATVFSVSPNTDEKGLFIPYWCISPESLFEFLCGLNDSLKNKFMDAVTEEKREFVRANPEVDMDVDKVTPYSPLPFRLKKIWYDLVYEDNVNWLDKEKTKPAFSDEGDCQSLRPPVFKPPHNANEGRVVKGGHQAFKKHLDQMRSRLLDSQYDFFLSPDDWAPDENGKIKLDLGDLIGGWLGVDKPVTILDLSGMPSSRLDLLLGALLDILFESALWGRNLKEGMKNKPLLLVMEEAHRYLSNDVNGFAKEMVRRIAKEGRKFGVGSMLVSQRPSEIDETILSQCGTLFALRINNATDRSRVKSAMSDGLSGIVDALPILRTGEAIITGEAAKLPMRCRFKVPAEGRFPDSKDPQVSEMWSEPYVKMDFSKLVGAWRQQKASLEEK